MSPGYIYIADEPTIITTVLGSCVSVALYDTEKKYGGMNHFLLPKPFNDNLPSTKYGNVAMHILYKTFIENNSNSKDLVASIIGGGYIENSKDSKYIADENIGTAKKNLNKLKISIIFEDVGGILGRKILYDTKLNDLEIIPIQKIDENYIKSIDKIKIL